jgi:hypothetical protein
MVPSKIRKKYSAPSTPAPMVVPSAADAFATLFGSAKKESVDAAIARFFYSNAIAFNVASSIQFRDMCDALRQARTGCKPPSRWQLGGKLLDSAYSDVERRLGPLYDQMKVTGVSLCSDGYTNSATQALCNVMLVTPNATIFRKMIVGTAWIFEKLSEVIEDVGPELITCVVMDNSEVNKDAGNPLMQRYKRIMWMGCAAHAIDLLIKDIGKHD